MNVVTFLNTNGCGATLGAGMNVVTLRNCNALGAGLGAGMMISFMT